MCEYLLNEHVSEFVSYAPTTLQPKAAGLELTKLHQAHKVGVAETTANPSVTPVE